MHLVSLQQAAGVEAHFTEFVRHAIARHPQWTHSLLNRERSVHPYFRVPLEQTLTHTVYAKYRWGIKLPSKPDWLRAWHCRRSFAKTNTDIALIWNRTARIGFVLDALGADNCIHWEHGAVWHPGHERERERYLRRIPLVIVNSNASARVLRLAWSYPGTIRICRNALRPSLMPDRPLHKPYPTGRAIRLGVAARLFPVKGVALVLHAVKMLNAQALEVELHVAGAGPELERLNRLAQELDIASLVQFHGAVEDMHGFYRDIDCLLHPPLTEAFGLVAIEAAAQGCPVIAAGVDGLPEAVKHGVSGYCVAPTLALAEYSKLGGSSTGIPQHVYDPISDALGEPRIVDPAALTAEVVRLFDDAQTYERISRSASEYVLREFQFDRHVDDVMRVIDEFRSGETTT